MTLYQFLKEFTLTSYPVTAAADVFVDDKTSLYLEAPVCRELPWYQSQMEFTANIVNQDSQLADLEVICVAPFLNRGVAPFLNRGKDKRTELIVYIKVDKQTLEALCRQIDNGTLLGRYWNA